MADLRCSVGGISAPNPFWLASAPPTDKAYNVIRGLKAGWGGIVWKTLGEDPPIINATARYGAVELNGQRMMGLNNIELITDRPLDVNLQEIKAIKRDWPDRAMVVSLMVACEEESWAKIVRQVEDTGADGIELNFGCPHGMNERGMGAAVGQVPEYVEMVTRFARKHTRMPILVKLTPNVTNILAPARAAKAGGADAVSLINTLNSIMAVDLDAMSPSPVINGKGAYGGYCGPAVRPIALQMVAQIARDRECRGMDISGIGGIGQWRDAAEFMALGADGLQVCTAVMHYGFAIVDDLIDGLNNWMDEKGYARLSDFRGRAVDNFVDWNDLDLNYEVIADIDQDKCIQCGLCYIACEDTSHQAIQQRYIQTEASGPLNGTHVRRRHYSVIREDCVGCNLCMHVCPVSGCISMNPVDNNLDYVTWPNHPKNPFAKEKNAAE